MLVTDKRHYTTTKNRTSTRHNDDKSSNLPFNNRLGNDTIDETKMKKPCLQLSIENEEVQDEQWTEERDR